MTYKTFHFGDHIDTDQIIPARFLVTGDPVELGRSCMSGVDPELAAQMQPGDVIVAGRNFGCGSSREHAPLSILGAGIQAVFAQSFARIFYRNSVNLGLLLFECPTASSIPNGAAIELDAESGSLREIESGRVHRSAPVPDVARRIMEAGGLMKMVAKEAGLTPRAEMAQ